MAAQLEGMRKRLEQLGAFDVKVVEEEKSPDEVTIWAHDMTVVPGKTYRYRISVEVYNPVFAKKLHLMEEQHDRADQITITSAMSDWTIPVHSDEWLKVFVTQARGPSVQQNVVGGLGLGQARADVFRFQDGRWWKESFFVEPGDRIGEVRRQVIGGQNGQEVSVDFTTNWFLLDVIEDIEAERRQREQGHAAQALIQNINDGSMVALRDPIDELKDRVRRRLLEEVELAEVASQVAGASAN